MHEVVRALLAATALLSLSACSPRPTEQTAVVKDGQWGKVYRGGYVEMVSVSGVQTQWRMHSALSIPAGELSAWFYVYLCNADPSNCVSIAQALVPFRAEAGHSYRARAQEQLNGSNRFWVWVEDEETGSAVSEKVLGVPGA